MHLAIRSAISIRARAGRKCRSGAMRLAIRWWKRRYGGAHKSAAAVERSSIFIRRSRIRMIKHSKNFAALPLFINSDFGIARSSAMGVCRSRKIRRRSRICTLLIRSTTSTESCYHYISIRRWGGRGEGETLRVGYDEGKIRRVVGNILSNNAF